MKWHSVCFFTGSLMMLDMDGIHTTGLFFLHA